MDFARALLLSVFLAFVLWETVRPCMAFDYGKGRARLSHGIRNIILGVIGSMISYLLFVRFWVMAAVWSDVYEFGLLRLLDLPPVAMVCVGLLIMDCWTYWWHRMNHRIRFLWRFHRVHHCDPWMDVTTAQRFHPGEMALSSLLRIPLLVLLGLEVWQIAVYDLCVLFVVFFHHSNISVPPAMERVLRLVIPTPVMHKIHHSRIQRETDSNYGAMMSIWDRLFGSFRLRDDWAKISFGLDEFDAPEHQDLSGLMKMPF